MDTDGFGLERILSYSASFGAWALIWYVLSKWIDGEKRVIFGGVSVSVATLLGFVRVLDDPSFGDIYLYEMYGLWGPILNLSPEGYLIVLYSLSLGLVHLGCSLGIGFAACKWMSGEWRFASRKWEPSKLRKR